MVCRGGAALALGALLVWAAACGLGRSGARSGDLPEDGAAGAGALPAAGGGAQGGDSSGGASDAGGADTGGAGGGGEPECGATGECVELPPSAGVVVLAASGICPPGWDSAQQLFDGVDPGCSACSCGTATGTCSIASVTARDSSGCSGAMESHAPLALGECPIFTVGADAYTTGAAVPSSGTCTASATSANDLTTVTLCSPPAALEPCGMAGVCAPEPPASAPVCLLVDGASCPAEWPLATPLYATNLDTRSCACACGAAPGSSCSGTTMLVWYDIQCTLLAGSVPAGSACTNVGQTGDSSVSLDPGSWTGDACAVQPQHTGNVAFSDERSLCCAE